MKLLYNYEAHFCKHLNSDNLFVFVSIQTARSNFRGHSTCVTFDNRSHELVTRHGVWTDNSDSLNVYNS
jgi:hypothetical protein